jgi:iron complex outermembrane receptor protein
MRRRRSWWVSAALVAFAVSSQAEPPPQDGVSRPPARAKQASGPTPAQSQGEPRALEVTVQGARPGTRGTTVERLDRKTLDRLGVASVAEALERIPSAMSGYGGRGERIVTLRGFDQRQLLVTIDSVPVQVPYDGQLDLGKIPIGLVDSVSLVKGAGSLLYGPNGLGGAINISTRRAGVGPALMLATETAPFYAQRMSGTGSYQLGPVAALGGVAFENVRYFPMASSFAPTYNENGGRRDNSDRQNVTATGKVRWDINDRHEVVGSLWHLEGRFGVPPGVYDLTRRFWRWADWYVNTYALAHGYRAGKFTADETVYYSTVGNTLDSYDDASYRSQRLPVSYSSTYADRTMGGNARIAYSFACRDKRCLSTRGWFGAKRDWHESQSNVGADWTTVDSTTLTGAGQIDGYLTRHIRWLAGSQIDGELPGRSSEGVKPEPAFAFGPMAAVTVQPIDNLELTASGAQRTRFPTLKERFSARFGNQEPNPGLSAERATNLSIDASYRPVQQVRIDLGFFDSEVRDLVTPVIIRPQVQQLQNQGRARFYGMEAAVRSRPLQWLELWVGWAAMKARRLDLEPPNDVVPYRPGQKLTAAVTFYPIPTVALTVVGRHIGGQSFQNPDTLQWGELGSMRLFDARVDLDAIEGVRVWVRATNITDANVQGRYSYPEPGRQIFAGLSLTWPDKRQSRGLQGVQ